MYVAVRPIIASQKELSYKNRGFKRTKFMNEGGREEVREEVGL